MRRQATLGALLLVVLGVALGATVFRSDIAQATGLKQSQSVIVDNSPAEAVPVREQNLDSGNIKVHEQGTVDVEVQNSSLSVAPLAVTTSRLVNLLVVPGGTTTDQFSSIDASLITISGTGDAEVFAGSASSGFLGVRTKGEEPVVFPLPQTLVADLIRVDCSATSPTSCSMMINLLGRP